MNADIRLLLFLRSLMPARNGIIKSNTEINSRALWPPCSYANPKPVIPNQPPNSHQNAAGKNNRMDRQSIGQKTERKIGYDYTEYDDRHNERNQHHVSGKLALQNRQYCLSDVNVCERGGYQRKDNELQTKIGTASHLFPKLPWVMTQWWYWHMLLLFNSCFCLQGFFRCCSRRTTENKPPEIFTNVI